MIIKIKCFEKFNKEFMTIFPLIRTKNDLFNSPNIISECNVRFKKKKKTKQNATWKRIQRENCDKIYQEMRVKKDA